MQSLENLLAGRDAALARGDRNLAVEIQMELNRRGYVEAAVPSVEMATPPRPRGRPRKIAQ